VENKKRNDDESEVYNKYVCICIYIYTPKSSVQSLHNIREFKSVRKIKHVRFHGKIILCTFRLLLLELAVFWYRNIRQTSFISSWFMRSATMFPEQCSTSFITKKTPWPESASELYRPSDSRLSAKLVQNFADKGCHVVSVTSLRPYCQFSFKLLLNCTHEAEWTPFLTHYFSENLVAPGVEPGPLDL
jgi:hypothetical protein